MRGLIAAAVVWLMGLAVYEWGIRPGQELARQQTLQQLQALSQLWQALATAEPLGESLLQSLRETPEGPTLETLLRRSAEGIDTEADRQQLRTTVERLERRLQKNLLALEEEFRRTQILWTLGLTIAVLLLGVWGGLSLLADQRRTSGQLQTLRLLLRQWTRGDWHVDLPEAEKPLLQPLHTLWTTTERVLQNLIAQRTDFELPAASAHPDLDLLYKLRETLLQRWTQESQQALTVQSLAAFSEILKESQTIPQLAERTISLLCRSLQAHMGALFVRQDAAFVLAGTYAYDLSQAAQRQFRFGEGFIGQAAAEKRPLRVHPVPPGYLRLRSGLGEANPHTLLLVPLIFQEETYGVVEIAALEAFSSAAEPFLEKIAEHIGAALANFVSREKLAALLSEEQALRKALEEKQAELLRSAELMEAAQQKLIESQTQLASQLSAIRSAALVVEVDAGGHILYANEAFLASGGFTLSRLQTDTLLRLVSVHQVARELEESLAARQVWQGSLPLITTFGELLWLQATFAPLEGADTSSFIGICFDITRQKAQEEELRHLLDQALAQEEKLREANQRLQAFSEELLATQTELRGQIAAVGNAAIVSETDLQGRIIRVNELFLQTYGYRAEEVLGQNHRILKSGHQSDEVFEDMWRTISQGEVWRGEVRNRTKDGQYLWVWLTITPVLSPEGKVIKYISVSFDITAQKRQEEELRAALELSQKQQQELRLYTQQLQAAQEEMRKTQVELRGQISAVHNAAIVAETDPEGRITFVNEAFCRISGYTREELLGQTHALLRSDRHDEAFFRQMWATLLEKRVWKGILCNRRKDGSLYWVSSAITPVVDTRGRLVKFIAVSFDLTPQVEQEERLREYAEELRQAQAELRGQILAVGNAAYLMETDPQGHLLYANSAALEVWGYTWEEVKGQNLRFLQSGHHTPEFWQEMWQTLARGEVWQNEVLNKNRRGKLFWQLLTITPIQDAAGEIFKYIGVAFDITAQKRQAERIRVLLQESQEKEQALSAYTKQLEAVQAELLAAQLELTGRINALNNAAIVSETDPEGCITFVNDEATYVWGYSREELIGQPHSIIRSPSQPAKVFERMWDRIKSGFVWQGELENRAKDGSPFWVHLTITPVLDTEGKPYKYIGVAFDITRQKVQAQRLKQTLRELEERAQQDFTDLAALFWFLTDREGYIQAASPALLRLLGYSAQQLIGQNARILRSPKTPDEVLFDLWATIGRGKPWYGFLTNKNAQGEEHLYFLAIFPQGERFLAVLLPAESACELLKADWLKNYAPLETLREYEALLQAKDYEIYELREIIHTLQSSLS